MYEHFTFLMVIAVFMVSIIFCYKLGFNHLRHFKEVFHIIFGKGRDTEKSLSSFSAVATIIGGNLGVGNISGMAVAITTGGPGAILWMSIIVLIASVIKYVYCFLGVTHRIETRSGNVYGGSMYYINDAFKNQYIGKILSGIYCLGVIAGAITIGNFVQVNSMTLSMKYFNIPAFFWGICIAVLVFGVISGGLHRFGKTISNIVPIMAILYICSCVYILTSYHANILPSIKLIFQSFFTTKAVVGGTVGFTIWTILQVGFSRGIFATDIGFALESIVHSYVKQRNSSNERIAIEQALVAAISPIIVIFICIITVLVLMTTGVWNNPDLQSTEICVEAFKVGISKKFGGHIITITLFFFAFTTVLTWEFCGEKAFLYLTKGRFVKIWNILFIFILPFGSIMQVKFLWQLADYSIPLMLLPNLCAIVLLSKEVIAATNRKFCKKETN